MRRKILNFASCVTFYTRGGANFKFCFCATLCVLHAQRREILLNLIKRR
ncbi:hypothetical protein CAMGR0001_1246 [Campylobacter gracilis RM3268]|uniref:Uncharacterized protein n=1 Tax=Campylobacter gracilis RM3268 TaxID=553220 RepID=C8PJ46_9BACT|nr:hypothetical protein CAMGR0001_1246 [Campylobacter gracilis RM3268]